MTKPSKDLKHIQQARKDFKEGKHVTLDEMEKKLKKRWKPEQGTMVWYVIINDMTDDTLAIQDDVFEYRTVPLNVFKTRSAALKAARAVKDLLKKMAKE